MPLNREETKQAMKEAMREWMDDKFKEFGRWTFFGFMTALFGAAIYFMLYVNGWHK
jgi:uncharacterized membrane protein YozB (DUF420 family)